MRKGFHVAKDIAYGTRPYVVQDNCGQSLMTQPKGKGRMVRPQVRRWKTAEAAQKVADLCNEAASYPHS